MICRPVYDAIDNVLTSGVHRHGDVYTADLRAMSDFEMDQADGKNSDIPKRFRDLDGKRVLLTGQNVVSIGGVGKTASLRPGIFN